MTRRAVEEDRTFSLSPTPIGWIGIIAGGAGLIDIFIHPDRAVVDEHLAAFHPGARQREGMAAQVQLQEYFRGERHFFSVPLDFGTISPFCRQVLNDLSQVPLGTTVTYGELAARCGRPGAARAVGRAMALNPFPVIVPCHRVVGAGGRLTGYSGGEGIGTKLWLLDFERRQAVRPGAVESGRKEEPIVKSP